MSNVNNHIAKNYIRAVARLLNAKAQKGEFPEIKIMEPLSNNLIIKFQEQGLNVVEFITEKESFNFFQISIR